MYQSLRALSFCSLSLERFPVRTKSEISVTLACAHLNSMPAMHVEHCALDVCTTFVYLKLKLVANRTLQGCREASGIRENAGAAFKK